MNQYIITEELRDLIMYRLLNEGYSDLLQRLKRETDDNPYNPQAEQERLIANIENWAWINRSVFFNNNAYNPLIEKLQELRGGKDGEKG